MTATTVIIAEGEALTVKPYEVLFRFDDSPRAGVEVTSTAWSRPSHHMTPSEARAYAAALVAAAEAAEAQQAEAEALARS